MTRKNSCFNPVVAEREIGALNLALENCMIQSIRSGRISQGVEREDQLETHGTKMTQRLPGDR
jgi:hypothetical protein